MPIIATIALESRCSSLGEHRQVLSNLEINNRCSFSSRCGAACYLNVVAPLASREALPAEQVLAAARETIRNGWDVRHLGLPGKEVLESPALLFQILEEFHSTLADTRPGSVGIITAHAAALKHHSRQLAEVPLGWVAISMDTSDSGLRLPQNNKPLLENALRLKEAGGTKLLGVNTVLTADNLSEVVRIGQQLKGLGIDQWAVSPLLQPEQNRMESVLSVPRLREIVVRLAEEFGGTGFNIVVDLDFEMLCALVGDPRALASGAGRWRTEYQLPMAPNIMLVAGNAKPAHFFRLRWDGQLMSKEDFRRVGIDGSYGGYEPGRISALLENFRTLRVMPLALT
jgi:hypothetical protein